MAPEGWRRSWTLKIQSIKQQWDRVLALLAAAIGALLSAGGYAGVAPEPPPMPGVFIAVGLIPARRAYSCTADE
jgi:hypothetical protein